MFHVMRTSHIVIYKGFCVCMIKTTTWVMELQKKKEIIGIIKEMYSCLNTFSPSTCIYV